MTIEEIKSRRRKITPAPWISCNEGRQIDTTATLDLDRVRNTAGPRDQHICTLDDGEYCIYSNYYELQDNADFIANAPEDIDWLLAEVGQLRNRLDIDNAPSDMCLIAKAAAGYWGRRANDAGISDAHELAKYLRIDFDQLVRISKLIEYYIEAAQP